MNLPHPFVSVIVPAYNGEMFLAETLESILSQDYPTYEIVFVDDGSTDATAKIVAGFGKRLRYVYQANSGKPAAARNLGLQLALGEIVAFLDQDDLWLPNALACRVNELVQNPELDVVLGLTSFRKLVPSDNGSREFREILSPRLQMLLSSAVFRRSVFDRVGLFDETLRYYTDDMDWFLRAREAGIKLKILNEVTLAWRLHDRNTSREQQIRDRALTEVVKRSLDRRRAHNTQRNTPVPKFSDFLE
ncbi:MAG TPA: glycosyltransferase family A protein [Terriglobales bacterium]